MTMFVCVSGMGTADSWAAFSVESDMMHARSHAPLSPATAPYVTALTTASPCRCIPSHTLSLLQAQAAWRDTLKRLPGESVLWSDFMGFVASRYTSFKVGDGVGARAYSQPAVRVG